MIAEQLPIDLEKAKNKKNASIKVFLRYIAALHMKFMDEKKEKEIDLGPEDLKGMTGENILAESKRTFLLPREGKLVELDPAQKVKISFDKD